MAIKALIKIVEHDKKGNLIEYKPGTKITTLSDKEEKRLIKIKAAEAIESANGSSDNTNQENNNSNSEENSDGDGPNTEYPGK
jgi:hypothetical protein